MITRMTTCLAVTLTLSAGLLLSATAQQPASSSSSPRSSALRRRLVAGKDPWTPEQLRCW